MKKIVIFGNSGSGKSTLAKELATVERLAHLDLDTIAWELTSPPERKPILDSKREIDAFITRNASWVIEGCYSDLLEIAISNANEIIFMNLSVATCISNARKRPWEPHKYQSKDAQDANLEMLIGWIAQYPVRDDNFSKKSHDALFQGFDGKKTMYTSNAR